MNFVPTNTTNMKFQYLLICRMFPTVNCHRLVRLWAGLLSLIQE